MAPAFRQEVSVAVPAPFVRIRLLLPETRFGIAVRCGDALCGWYPAGPGLIMARMVAGAEVCTVEYHTGGVPAVPPPPPATGPGDLELTVRMLNHTQAQELSHKFTMAAGTDLAGFIRGLTMGRTRSGSRTRVHDDRNPFGPDDFYISMYTGTLFCPVVGAYGFAIDSDDGSILTVDGAVAVEWGGLHGAAGDWSHAGTVDLAAGPHAFWYGQFEGGGGQLAAAAWKPPGAEGFRVLETQDFIRCTDAVTTGLTDAEGRALPFPVVIWPAEGVQTRAGVRVRGVFTAGGPPDGARTWTINGQPAEGNEVVRYCVPGTTVTCRMEGFPDEVVCGTAPLPATVRDVDARLSVGGILPVVYPDEAVSVWLRVERNEAGPACAYTLRRSSAGAGPDDGPSELVRLPAGDAADMPPSLARAATTQWVLPAGRTRAGAECVFELAYEGLPVDRTAVRFVDAAGALPPLRVAGNRFAAVSDDATVVMVAPREDGAVYRRWLFARWAERRIGPAAGAILAVVSSWGTAGECDSILRAAAPDSRVVVQAAAGAPYPFFDFPAQIDAALAAGTYDAVVLVLGPAELENEMPAWIYPRLADLCIARVRRAADIPVIIVGPPPVTGRTEALVTVNRALAALAREHHVGWVDTLVVLGGPEGWPARFTRGGNDLHRAPDAAGLALVAAAVDALLP